VTGTHAGGVIPETGPLIFLDYDQAHSTWLTLRQPMRPADQARYHRKCGGASSASSQPRQFTAVRAEPATWDEQSARFAHVLSPWLYVSFSYACAPRRAGRASI